MGSLRELQSDTVWSRQYNATGYSLKPFFCYLFHPVFTLQYSDESIPETTPPYLKYRGIPPRSVQTKALYHKRYKASHVPLSDELPQ